MSHATAPMGIAMVTVRTRFAGLHRPDPSRDSILLTDDIPDGDEDEDFVVEKDVVHSMSPSKQQAPI